MRQISLLITPEGDVNAEEAPFSQVDMEASSQRRVRVMVILGVRVRAMRCKEITSLG